MMESNALAVLGRKVEALWNLAIETFRHIPPAVVAGVGLVISFSTMAWGVSFGATLLALSLVAFFQNMAFTAVSRSRNGADTSYHRRCAWLSNGIWLLCQLFIWKHLWVAFSTGTFLQLAPLMFIYVVSTAEGSVAMMERLLVTETGKRRVGAIK